MLSETCYRHIFFSTVTVVIHRFATRPFLVASRFPEFDSCTILLERLDIFFSAIKRKYIENERFPQTRDHDTGTPVNNGCFYLHHPWERHESSTRNAFVNFCDGGRPSTTMIAHCLVGDASTIGAAARGVIVFGARQKKKRTRALRDSTSLFNCFFYYYYCFTFARFRRRAICIDGQHGCGPCLFQTPKRVGENRTFIKGVCRRNK